MKKNILTKIINIAVKILRSSLTEEQKNDLVKQVKEILGVK